jgi:hypothetical protein
MSPIPPARDRSSANQSVTRDLPLHCRACARPFVLQYRYDSAEGMSPRRIRCPHTGCGAGQDVYLPVNAYDLKRSLDTLAS